VVIGRDGGASDGYAAGTIDEVAIYGTALSAAQAQAHYNAAATAVAHATATAQAPTIAARTANANATASAQAAIVNATATAQAANANATASAQAAIVNATATAEAGNGGVTLRACPSGCPYARIQDAVNAAPPGATVQVGAGVYTETVTISKSLTLAGSGSSQTVIGGTGLSAPASLVTITGTALGVTLSGLTLRGNVGPTGAGLFNNGRPGLETTRLVNVVVTRNSTFVGSGGGIADAGGNLEVISSTISGNVGGGIALLNGGIALTLVASTVAGNSASSGGGIAGASSDTMRLLDSTVYNNVAQLGGGIYTAGALTLTASTVYSNAVTDGSGGGVFAQSGATVALTDTILAGNSARGSATGPDCSATLRSGGYNMLGAADASCSGPVDGQNGDQVGTATTPLDPRLGPLRDNGGPTPTLAPLAGSPVNDIVPPSYCIGPTDQRGSPRPVPVAVTHGFCTVGAVEYDLTPTTRYVAPTGSDNGDCTLSATPCRTIRVRDRPSHRRRHGLRRSGSLHRTDNHQQVPDAGGVRRNRDKHQRHKGTGSRPAGHDLGRGGAGDRLRPDPAGQPPPERERRGAAQRRAPRPGDDLAAQRCRRAQHRRRARWRDRRPGGQSGGHQQHHQREHGQLPGRRHRHAWQ